MENKTMTLARRMVAPIVSGTVFLIPLTFVLRLPILSYGCFAVLLVAGLATLRSQGLSIYRCSAYVVAGFIFYLPYSVVDVLRHDSAWRIADNGVHFLFFVLMAPAFFWVKDRRFFWCGLSLSGIAMGGFAVYQKVLLHIDRPYGDFGYSIATGTSGAIKFGMVATLLSVLSLFLAIRCDVQKRERAFHLFALLSGVLAVVLSASRGPVIVLFLMLPTAFAIRYADRFGSQLSKRLVSIGLLGLIALCALVFFSTKLPERFHDITVEITRASQGDFNSSVGNRLAMWQTGWRIFLNHPFDGVGMDGFGDVSRQMIAAGTASPAIAIYNHVHDEYLEALVTGGLPGFALLLWLFITPILVFFRSLRRGFREDKNTTVASCGLIVALCFPLFAFTDNIFDRQVTSSLFAFLTLAFVVLLTDRQPINLTNR